VIEHPERGYCRFVVHSVVRDEQGQLFDPTPPGTGEQYPFLPHPYTAEEFVLMLARRGPDHIDHYLQDRDFMEQSRDESS
jgi:hypothetical protein